MAQCAYCNAETQLLFFKYTNLYKMCGSGRRERTQASLTQKLADATLRADAACETFQKVMADIPSRRAYDPSPYLKIVRDDPATKASNGVGRAIPHIRQIEIRSTSSKVISSLVRS